MTVHCIHTIPSLAASGGGPTTAVVGMTEELGRAGLDVDVCCLDLSAWGSSNVELDPALVSVHAVPVRSAKLAESLIPREFFARLNELAHPGSVINSHGLWTAVERAAALCASRRGLPHVISLDGMLAPRALQRSRMKKKLAGLLYARRTLRQCACLHALTEVELADARRYGATCPIAVIPNGVDTARFSRLPDRSVALERWPALKDRRIMLFLGRLHPIKGLDVLIPAWANVAKEYPDWALVVAGPDETGMQGKLQELAKRGGVAERTLFTGPAYGPAKDALLAAAEVFCLPSYSEGFSAAILEAAASGLPVLITPQCNFPKVGAIQAGWIVEPQQAAMENALREILALPGAELDAIGQRGRKLAQEEYDWRAIAVQMRKVYEWVLGLGAQPACVEGRSH